MAADLSIPISRDDLEKARVRLKEEKGIDLLGDEAEVEQDGVKVALVYDGANLDISLVKVPFKYKMFKGKIKDEIQEWFKV